MADTALPVHLRLRRKLRPALERRALRAVLSAAHLLGLAAGCHLRKLRERADPLLRLQAQLEEAELRARLAGEAAQILADRFAKVADRHRPHYTPAQRFRILEIRSLLAWNATDTAKTFLVSSHTILNWERSADPAARTAGSTVAPVPPVRRAADVVRHLAQRMAALGLGGQDLCARILARAGWKLSPRSIARYWRETAAPVSPDPEPRKPTHPVSARFIHHVWMIDVSLVKQFLGRSLFIAAVFDASSRVPLAVQVLHRAPKARAMARLLKLAGRAFGQPRYVLTDQGPEFTGEAFQKTVRRLGAKARFASKDTIYATARLERFWRTLKETAGLYRLHLPLTRFDLEQRLALALLQYLVYRPHAGLAGATPAEVFLAIEPAHLKAVEPPRGRPREGPSEAPFEITFRDPDTRRFPLLTAA